jgi:hypothetical protein
MVNVTNNKYETLCMSEAATIPSRPKFFTHKIDASIPINELPIDANDNLAVMFNVMSKEASTCAMAKSPADNTNQGSKYEAEAYCSLTRI